MKFTRNITVEPFIIYIIANVLTALAAQNLYLEKACRVNLKFKEQVCDALAKRQTQNYKAKEIQVQKLVARMIEWKTVVQTFIPCLLILFVGSWSDRNKWRKPCMLIPVFGELISSVVLALNVYFKDLPMEYAGMTEALFEGITGGSAVMFMGAHSYIADITSNEQRTVRLGIANACFKAGVPIATLFCGYLLNWIDFYGVFMVSVVMHGIAFFYGLYFIKESSEDSKKFSLSDFFNPTNPISTLKILGKKNFKLQFGLLMVLAVVVVGPSHGERAILYLFARFRFNWALTDFGIYMTVSHLITIGGALATIALFSHRLHMHDTLVGIIGSVSKIAASFVYAFAMTSLGFYLGSIVEICHYASLICMRSIASKMVEKDERGRLNSLLGVIEALTPTIYAPLYSRIYAATITTVPGAFFLVGGGLKIIAVAIFLFMFFSHKSNDNTVDDPVEILPLNTQTKTIICPTSSQTALGDPNLLRKPQMMRIDSSISLTEAQN